MYTHTHTLYKTLIFHSLISSSPNDKNTGINITTSLGHLMRPKKDFSSSTKVELLPKKLFRQPLATENTENS